MNIVTIDGGKLVDAIVAERVRQTAQQRRIRRRLLPTINNDPLSPDDIHHAQDIDMSDVSQYFDDDQGQSEE